MMSLNALHVQYVIAIKPILNDTAHAPQAFGPVAYEIAAMWGGCFLIVAR